ncbi:MAG: decaprenyl-phosphate phosphoribosyltransferase [Proteobacteria bacterium]|nr:decaprenyl-phosphate phosphoribosyltransferase [Pseudomonadota bacterium]
MPGLVDFIKTARPHQYLKNGFVWLPLFFGHKLHDPSAALMTGYAFLAFCLGASSIYTLNDLKDVEADRNHPEKKNRPIASGKLTLKAAWAFMILLTGATLIFSILLLPGTFVMILLAYLGLNVLYSLFLKHVAIVDIILIATGFVIRVIGGGIAANVAISHWIIIMTFLIALFLALAKRRDDLILSETGLNTRKNIDGYNHEFISLSMGIMASVIIVSYILYTVSTEIQIKYDTHSLYTTAFWVLAGILRYLQITFVEQKSGSPTLILMKDVFLQAIIVLWFVNFYLIIYLQF